MAKGDFHAGELLPRVGFIVTNLETPSRAVVRFYNKRGTGGRLVKHARNYWLLLAESHLTRRLGAMLEQIALLPVPTG